MKLPLIDLTKLKHFEVTEQKKIPVFGGLVLLFLGLYLFTNRYHLVEPRTMTFLDWEMSIPLVSWTAWFYVSDYIYPVVVGFLLRNSLITTRTCLAFFLQSVLANLTFYFFPVRFPRELWPTEAGDMMIQWIRMVDQDANCFPSAHVSIVALTYIAWIRENPKRPWFFGIWGFLICVSTLTTKQHYFIDILAGIVLGGFCYVLAERLVVKEVK